MRTGTSGLITLAIPSLAGTYFSELAQCFADEAQRRRHSIMLHSTAAGREEEHSVLSGFTRVLGDGVVFNPMLIGEDVLAELGHTIQPTVFIGEHLEEGQLPSGSDYVRTDNARAAYDATRHLLAAGRRAGRLSRCPLSGGRRSRSTPPAACGWAAMSAPWPRAGRVLRSSRR